jgi:galactonate dehydratase
MKRRALLRTLAATPALGMRAAQQARPSIPKMKITRVRAYSPSRLNSLFNQSNVVVTVETDAGITGIGEGGSRDTIEQCAGRLIGQDPTRTEHLWQDMYRAYFYPPGREKVHALGALDMALWDIRGKALGVPVHQLLGGLARNYMECYYTGGGFPGSIKERARATMEAGFRAFRIDAASLREGTTYNSHERVNQLYEDCVQAREGVGKNGDWCIDFHTRFDLSDAVRAARLIEDLAPYFVEDPVRSEGFNDLLPVLRGQVKVPIAAGEQWGSRWDFNKLIENNSIDYVRCTIPNVGGITEWTKVAALCETHFIGLIPHFTGPISTAALVHACGPFSGPVLMEFNSQNGVWDYLPRCLEFKNGKIWPNQRPGLGVEVDLKRLKMMGEFTEPITNRVIYYRPDGSITNW